MPVLNPRENSAVAIKHKYLSSLFKILKFRLCWVTDDVTVLGEAVCSTC